MIIDGRAISASIRHKLKHQIESLPRQPGLAFLLVGDHAPSKTYVSMKSQACREVGIASHVIQLPSHIQQHALLAEIARWNEDPTIDGILVQMPLPPHLSAERVCESLDPAKDVDGFHPLNAGKLLLGREDGFFPCTPEGILRLLQSSGISTIGQQVAIIGRSQLVGSPLAALLSLKKPWGNATVTLAHSYTQDVGAITRSADIVVAAIGSPHFVTASMIKEGATVVDVGINAVPDATKARGYRLVGDVAFDEVAPKCRAITPVPGGVGPMTIALLLEHTVKSALRSKDRL